MDARAKKSIFDLASVLVILFSNANFLKHHILRLIWTFDIAVKNFSPFYSIIVGKISPYNLHCLYF